jgi:hypothetical protein
VRPRLKRWQWALAGFLLFTLASWLAHRPDARARQLNEVIEAKASPALKAYPYEFRVVRTEGSIAVMSTPRNYDVPAFKMLHALYPQLDVKNPDDPAFVAAEKALGNAQAEARGIVLAQPGITDVHWTLDKRWLRSHDIDVPDQ